MAIILPQTHFAHTYLESQNLPVITEAANEDAESQRRTVTLGFVNVMPTEYLEETVNLLLARLSKAPYDVKPVFISPEGKDCKGVSWAQARDQKPDCILITGYAASNLPFEELDFWPELKTIIKDAEAASLPLLGVCAGAMAVAYAAYGIKKEQAPHKLLGNYEYQTPEGARLYLATSRNNTLNRAQLLGAVKEGRLQIAAETDDTPQPEPAVLTDKRRDWVLTLAHLEYAYTTCNDYPGFEGQDLNILDYQYRRDHNEQSPKYDPALAARVLPPVNLELSPAQVKAREEYAESLLSQWVARSYGRKCDLENMARLRETVRLNNYPKSTYRPGWG